MNIICAVIIAVFLILFILFTFTVFTGAPFVPTLTAELEEAFTNLVKLNKKDLVIDLGSGSGSVLGVAAEHGARAFGIEINPVLVLFSRFKLRKYPDVKVRLGTYCTVSFPDETTIIYLFSATKYLPRILRRIQSESNRLNKKLKIISYGFQLEGINHVKQHRAFFLYEINPQNK